MKTHLSCFLISLSLFTSCSFAAPTCFTGEQLLTDCRAALDILDYNFGRVQIQSEYLQGNRSGICQGYMMSVNEMQSSNAKKLPAFCLPLNYTQLRGAAAVVQYLENNPSQQMLPPSQIVLNAFKRYFPCRQLSLR